MTIMAAVLDTDTLLENDLVTLDEALRTTNNAVLMAINTISILLSVSKLFLLYVSSFLTSYLLILLCYFYYGVLR